jgi:serine/threonine protein kinase
MMDVNIFDDDDTCGGK